MGLLTTLDISHGNSGVVGLIIAIASIVRNADDASYQKEQFTDVSLRLRRSLS